MEPSNVSETISNQSNDETAGNPQKKLNDWTIIIYHSGDADLGEEFIWALKEMVSVGTPEGVGVVALMDSIAPDLWEFTIPSGTAPAGKAGAIGGDAAQRVEDDDEGGNVFDKKKGRARVVPLPQAKETNGRNARNNRGGMSFLSRADLASSGFLSEYVVACIQKYPARHYFLVLSGHGAGIYGETFLRDQSAGRYMSVPRLDWALSEVVKKIGESSKAGKQQVIDDYRTQMKSDEFDPRIDILGLDSCGMMTAEVAHLLKDEVKYMVASEGYMTMAGWPYYTILKYLIKNPEAEPEDLATEVVRRCVRYYTSFARVGVSVDLAACDLNQGGWDVLAGAIKKLTERLRTEVKRGNMEVINAVIAAHWYAQSYAIEQYVDLHDFCEQLMNAAPVLKKECNDIIGALTPLVKKSCYAGAGYQQSHGVSLYFPWVATKEELSRYRVYVPHGEQEERFTNFNAATNWGEFLAEFIDFTRRRPRGEGLHDDGRELIFMPPLGYFDHIEGNRTGTPADTRTGIIDDIRGKMAIAKVKNIALHYYEDKCEKEKGRHKQKGKGRNKQVDSGNPSK